MRNYVVKAHKNATKLNIYGNPVGEEFEYTISYKMLGIFWRHLRFYPELPANTPMVCRCLESKEVEIMNMPLRMSTRFCCEADAIRVRNDMLSHPDKYVYTNR